MMNCPKHGVPHTSFPCPDGICPRCGQAGCTDPDDKTCDYNVIMRDNEERNELLRKGRLDEAQITGLREDLRLKELQVEDFKNALDSIGYGRLVDDGAPLGKELMEARNIARRVLAMYTK